MSQTDAPTKLRIVMATGAANAPVLREVSNGADYPITRAVKVRLEKMRAARKKKSGSRGDAEARRDCDQPLPLRVSA